MLAAALGYAARDWPVFPCAGKVPRTLHGCKDASTDSSHVGEWWGRWPAADVAVATGDGLLVVDVDGQAGADTLHDLERAYDELPQTICATTGGGGVHYYFAAPCGYRSSAGALGPGLDIRAAGGYVIAPPSSHRSGGRYVWDLAPEDTKLALAPGWLLTLLGRANRAAARPVSEWRALAAGGATEGARNDSAARLAGHLLARKVDPHVVHALVVAWDAQRNRPPLGEAEITSTVESIARAELRRRR